MNYLKVCCAIIQDGDKFLAVQRSNQMSHPLQWEFPGGKIELNETAENALIREIKEELSVDIEIYKTLETVIHHYTKVSIELYPFMATITCGEIQLTEHQDSLWLHKDELLRLDWVAADIPIATFIAYDKK